MREQAADGRAVLISSHLLAEVAQSVDDAVVITDGELRAQGPLEQVLGGGDGSATTVRAQDPVLLTAALERRGRWRATSGCCISARAWNRPDRS